MNGYGFSRPDHDTDVPRRLSAIPGFALECELGRGAFAVVYLAVNRTLESPITLKPLRMLMLGQGEDAQVQDRANLLGLFLEDHNLLDHDFAAVLAQVE
jgi:hypothetical protein